jgi:hypothetical protein
MIFLLSAAKLAACRWEHDHLSLNLAEISISSGNKDFVLCD